MEVLKQAVSVPIFGTVIWLIWLFTQTTGPNALIGLLAAFLLLAIAGWVLGRWPGKTFAATCAALLILPAIAICVYAVKNLSAPLASATGTAATAKDWEPFTPAVVENYRAQGRPVFVDFTAKWCLSCQVNERIVLDREDIQRRLKSSGVALVRADWTRHDESIAQALATLGRSGVPTYALYSGDAKTPPQLLPEVLTPGIVIDALNSLPKSRSQAAQAIQPTQP
jgi:thiol:disulfide interchange protein DsbD